MSMRNGRASAPKSEERTPLTREKLRQSLLVFRYLLPYKWAFISGMFFLAAGSLLFLGIMKVPGELFNVIAGKSEYGASLNQLFLFLLVLLAIQSVFSYLRVQLFALVSEKSMALLRTDLYQKLITLGIPFLESRRVGELTSRISTDVTQVQNVFSITLAEFLRQIIILVGGIAIIVITMPKLALTMLATFPVIVILAMYFGRHIRKLMKDRQDQLAQTNVVVEETMQSIQTVKAYTNEWFEINRYGLSLKEAVRLSLKGAHLRGLFAAFIIFVMFGALFFIMWRAALMVQSGQMLEGELVDFVVFTGIIGGAIASIGSFYTEIVSAIGATERIQEILKEDSEVEITPPSYQQLPRLSGEIDYENVHFAYPSRSDMPVLKGIDLHINPGEKVALVGASGAGKSTIVQLLLRFYQAQSGTIRMDGQDILSYPLTHYRRNIAIVPQEVLLFGGTIRENILYGKPDATEAEIMEASKKANAWDFIRSFPDGFETLVGERGIKLSGGQRQRIAIARAILKDPAVLLLDEATSSLDAESEKAVQDALNKLMKGRTSIIIAHRLATIRDVDCIYVIDGGQIVEKGTHDELSSIEDGAYNALAKLQFDILV
ncbi:MAG: ABC transporter transmembrane domain-containing protein [Saprospiraceae bacterium]|nr:ABC transporter transmembrane domain-containing protein [Saprospiraceae bacterium]MDZ4703251.1 ABC transporter transmembrane domain-containing protein [Saprospiraceae bacterium]